MELTYYRKGDYLFPNLAVKDEPQTIGKYGMLRRTYLKENRKNWYQSMLMSGRLNQHLAEIEESARRMVEQTVQQMAQTEGVTEELKATDPVRWTGLMNNLRHSAEELILNDLIYS